MEDCILNGRLRELEVLVKDHWFEGLEKLNDVEDVSEEFENWRVLKRVCRDPYLQRVVLRGMPLNEIPETEPESSRYES